MLTNKQRLAACCMAIIWTTGATTTQAGKTQDCILEGIVQETKAAAGKKSIYIDFHSAKRLAKDKTCDFDERDFSFSGIVGSQIANTPPGAAVKFYYVQEGDQNGQWQLMEVSI